MVFPGVSEAKVQWVVNLILLGLSLPQPVAITPTLSDFKEHSTIDIQKGYLTGRYGSIPFSTNLKDLNWNKYDTAEQAI